MKTTGFHGVTAAVFSHAGHELAVYGILRRLHPHVLFLTDSGGPDRLAQTREVTRHLGVQDLSTFFDYEEDDLYRALVRKETDYLCELTSRVSAWFKAIRPDQVICDGVEFYNPVHDITLPIVRGALAGWSNAPIYEIPLFHQAPGDGEQIVVNRAGTDRQDDELRTRLSDDELEAKLYARANMYPQLVDANPLILALSVEHLVEEAVLRSADPLPVPGEDPVMRYERRGRLLRESGDVEDVITYTDHFLPLADAVMATGTN